MIVSGGQQRDSATHMYPFSPKFPSLIEFMEAKIICGTIPFLYTHTHTHTHTPETGELLRDKIMVLYFLVEV